MSNIKLSVLVATVPSRINSFFPKLINELMQQSNDHNDVEILGLFDNKKRTVGEKRQDLLNLARGEYLVFIDDDDRVDKDYISDILTALNNNPQTDCVVFDCICTMNGGSPKHCQYGIEFDYVDYGTTWFGKPAHTMVYKSSIAKAHSYVNRNFGEDIDWVKRACTDIKQQTRINKVLYYYDFNSQTTETRS